jgi:S-adenosylmethionine hydrolase
MPIITLASDFGLRDHYVAAMKGVILQIAPAATLVDLTHEIERHNVLHGAFILRQAMPWYPQGTIHAVVVDPGVGTRRRIIVGRYAGQFVIAPDNGLISFLHHEVPVEEVYAIDPARVGLNSISRTFHGRDIIAPAAARLAAGARLRDLGTPTDHVEVLQIAHPQWIGNQAVRGRVIYADIFGNLITNLKAEDVAAVHRLRPQAQVTLAGEVVGPVRGTYGEVAAGEPLALIGSTGLLEIAVHGGSAKERFRASPDAVIELK